MGEFNQITNLNQEGIAKKLFKFKMRSMRKAAVRGGFPDARHVEVLKGGMCTGYTLLWLREQWIGDRAFAFAEDGTYEGVLGSSGGGVGMLGVRLQTLYERNVRSPQDIPMALEMLGRAVGLDIAASNPMEFDSLDDALQELNDIEDRGTYYVELYLTEKISGSGVSHAIGVNAPNPGEFYAFDANCGEYLVEGPTMFGLSLSGVYETLLNARVDCCLVSKVSRHGL